MVGSSELLEKLSPNVVWHGVLHCCSNDADAMVGPKASGEGFKARSPELLRPLQMRRLEVHMEVLPATASLDTTPMETLTALADSAAATSSLQKQVGPFVDSLADGVHHGPLFLCN